MGTTTQPAGPQAGWVPPAALRRLRCVDLTDDSGSDVAEVVVIAADSKEEQLAEARAPHKGPPLRFGGYRRGRELGHGAGGQVFVCRGEGRAGGLAVKAIDVRRLKLSPNAEREEKKLRREVEILKDLPPHPNIVQLVDARQEGDWLLLVLEMVGGGDLLTALTGRLNPRFSETEAAFVLRQLASGLSFLHSRGVIHRDLKLENVLVASSARQHANTLYSVKITDFGLSKAVGAGRSEARSMVGTHPYIAPEVLQKAPHDFSADLWGLGVLLFVLLAGHFPFGQVASSQQELDDIVAGVDLSEDARAVLSGLLQLEPGGRSGLELVQGHRWLQPRADGPQAPATSPAGGDAAPRGDASDVRGQPPKRQRTSGPDAAAAAGAAAEEEEEERRRGGGAAAAETGAPEVPPQPPPQAPGSAPAAAAAGAPGQQPRRGAAGARPRGPAEPREAAAGLPHAPAHEGDAPPPAPSRPPLPAAEPASGLASPLGPWAPELQLPGAGRPEALAGLASPLGTWTPLAVEASLRLSEVQPPSCQVDVMQLHMVVPDRLAGAVLGRGGARIQQISLDAGCRVWMTPRADARDRRVVVIGTFKQCRTAQELVHEQIADALHADWRDTEAEVLLLVRAEAAGVVTGKQGFILNKIREQSGACIQLWREEHEGQRPCSIAGTLQSVLRAERHIFDLVRAVPAEARAEACGSDRAEVEAAAAR